MLRVCISSKFPRAADAADTGWGHQTLTVTAPNNSFSLLEALESEFIESDFMKSGQTKESEGMLQQRALWTRTRVARLAGGGKTSRLLVTLALSLPLLRPL